KEAICPLPMSGMPAISPNLPLAKRPGHNHSMPHISRSAAFTLTSSSGGRPFGRLALCSASRLARLASSSARRWALNSALSSASPSSRISLPERGIDLLGRSWCGVKPYGFHQLFNLALRPRPRVWIAPAHYFRVELQQPLADFDELVLAERREPVSNLKFI